MARHRKPHILLRWLATWLPRRLRRGAVTSLLTLTLVGFVR